MLCIQLMLSFYNATGPLEQWKELKYSTVISTTYIVTRQKLAFCKMDLQLEWLRVILDPFWARYFEKTKIGSRNTPRNKCMKLIYPTKGNLMRIIRRIGLFYVIKATLAWLECSLQLRIIKILLSSDLRLSRSCGNKKHFPTAFWLKISLEDYVRLDCSVSGGVGTNTNALCFYVLALY